MSNKYETEMNDLKEKLEKQQKYIEELEEHLKKYTNNTRHLKYYENNKEVVKERTKNYVEKLKETNPIYSLSDVQSALKYASESVTIYPEEVGKEVYDILFSEKVNEYLINRNNELETIYR